MPMNYWREKESGVDESRGNDESIGLISSARRSEFKFSTRGKAKCGGSFHGTPLRHSHPVDD